MLQSRSTEKAPIVLDRITLCYSRSTVCILSMQKSVRPICWLDEV